MLKITDNHRELLDKVMGLVAEFDGEGRFVYVNPYFSAVSGFSAEEVLGKSFTEFIHEKDHKEALENLSDIKKSFIKQSVRNLLCKDGSVRQIRVNSLVLSDEKDTPSGVLSICEDISDIINKANMDLVEQHERFERILSELKIGMVLLSPDLTVLWANDLMHKMFPQKELVGTKCYIIAENRTSPCEGCQSVLALSDGLPHVRVFMNSLDKRWYHVVALPIKNETGKVISVLEATTDISEQRQAEEALLLAQEKFRDFFRNIHDYGFIVSPDGTIVEINDFALSSLGYNKEELIGKPLTMLYAPESQQKMNELFNKLKEIGQISNEEFVLITKQGKRFIVLLNAGVVRDKDGNIRYYTSVQIDITAYKQAMKEIEVLKNRLEEENIYLREEITNERGFSEIIGKSNALLYVLTKIQQVAGTKAAALIQGETGVGKELVARAIHKSSLLSGRPFIKVDCTSLPVNLVESALFGHEKGAFTGAELLRKGRFEVADGGTIFLDEIGELPLEVQSKLLRILEHGEFERVGSSQTIHVAVRVIAASNRNLLDEVNAGRFRADLFYRLNVYPITVPPLRSRREDIPLLVQHFVPKISARDGKEIDQVSPAVMDELMQYDWPGNVRELRNVLERSVITSVGRTLGFTEGLEQRKTEKTQAGSVTQLPTLAEVERQHILKVLDQARWRVSGPDGAAQILGINPSTLRFRMKKLHIKRLN